VTDNLQQLLHTLALHQLHM